MRVATKHLSTPSLYRAVTEERVMPKSSSLELLRFLVDKSVRRWH